MLSVIHTAVAHNVDGQHPILVFPHDLFDDECLIDGRSHGHGVVAGFDDKVGERGCPDESAVDVVGESYVAHADGEDGGVGDEDLADHVGAVGFRGELDAEGRYVEACKTVKSCVRY